MVSDTYFSKEVFRGNAVASLMKMGSEFQAFWDRHMIFLSSVSVRLDHQSAKGIHTVLKNHYPPEVQRAQALARPHRSYS